ncbi:MAG: C40 family peptidase, partial [Desulfuromonadales bacterium]|nr:C40 family peptidase [Desulfuromonadales bacterium]
VFSGNDGKTPSVDHCGQFRELEFIALPGTLFKIEAEFKVDDNIIYRVTINDYPYPSKDGYYLDARSVKLVKDKPEERKKILLPKSEIIAAMKSRVGFPYVWGGNIGDGLDTISAWYPLKPGQTGPEKEKLRRLQGLDCSGLLYEATKGYTPRNSSSLINYGDAVPIEGKSAEEITDILQPLDLIIWHGHVMIVIDEGNVIDSRLVCSDPSKGVRIRPVLSVIKGLMERRKPANDAVKGAKEFVVRRWYKENKE